MYTHYYNGALKYNNYYNDLLNNYIPYGVLKFSVSQVSMTTCLLKTFMAKEIYRDFGSRTDYR